jgi:hypothetical protein
MPKPATVGMLVTVARAFQAAITAINDKHPTHVCFLTTRQFEDNVPKVLEQVEIPGTHLVQITVHNNLAQTYFDTIEAFEKLRALKPKPTLLYADLTSCTTPMSIAVWEACKDVEAVPHWIDFTDGGVGIVHRLSDPR